MVTEPWLDQRIPFKLLAYELFKNIYILSSVALRTGYQTPILIEEIGSPFTSCFTFTIIFIFVKIATAFFIVSDEMDSRWLLILQLKSDCPNHCISVMNLGAGMGVAFLSNLKRQRQVIQQDQTTGQMRDQQKLKQLPVKSKATTNPSYNFIIPLETRVAITSSYLTLFDSFVDRQNSFSSRPAKKQLCMQSQFYTIDFLFIR